MEESWPRPKGIYLYIKFNHKMTSEEQTKNEFYRIYLYFSFVLHDLKTVVFKEQLKVVLHVFNQKNN